MLLLALPPLFAALFAGCFFVRVSTRNAAVLFRTPDKVPDRITDPRRPEARLAVLWVGHATLLVQMDDKYILTDPIFTNFIGTVSHRLVEPGILPENLPPLAAVVISHRHYDHMSPESIELIAPRVEAVIAPEATVADIPPGPYVRQELRWGQGWDANGLRITAVPVKHVGGRAIDAASHPRSFTGYVFEYHGLVVYYPGDTAYRRDLFTDVAARYPKIDLALLPIGPIAPRDFMQRTHMDPAEAMRAAADLGALRMIPIHYDTFINSDDDVGDSLRALAPLVPNGPDALPQVTVLRIGEQRTLIQR